MNRKTASSRETRHLILSAAKTLFAEFEPSKCTIRGIAKKAGVSPASVMVHFKTKDALLESTIHEEIEATLTKALATLPASGGLLESFMHISRTMFRFYDTNRNLYRVLVANVLVRPSSQTPHVSRQMEQYLTLLAEMVKEQQTAGRVRKQTDPQISAGALASLYFGALILLFREPDMSADDALNLLEATTRQYLHGILTPSAQ